jgi:hypothetical protein
MSSVSALKVFALFGKKLLLEDALLSQNPSTMTPPTTATVGATSTAQDMSYAAAVQAPATQNLHSAPGDPSAPPPVAGLGSGR